MVFGNTRVNKWTCVVLRSVSSKYSEFTWEIDWEKLPGEVLVSAGMIEMNLQKLQQFAEMCRISSEDTHPFFSSSLPHLLTAGRNMGKFRGVVASCSQRAYCGTTSLLTGNAWHILLGYQIVIFFINP